MQLQSIGLLAATIIGSIFSIDTYASIDVYTQAPNKSNFAPSAVLNASNDPGFNWTFDNDQERWDYFSVGSNVSFNRIGWYGSNSDGNFAVDLFSATCFSCGATQVNGGGTFSHSLTAYNSLTLLPNLGPFSQTDVHKTLVSNKDNLYSYYIDLTSNLTLDPAKTYALSVVNNFSSLPFNWALSNTGGNHLQYVVGQSMFLPAPGGLAFTLTDTSVSAVPVPASAWLLGSGLVYLLSIARKRNTA